ncbi:MAG: DUF3291 domain-containing protein [Rhodothalassiaceae bacterium]
MQLAQMNIGRLVAPVGDPAVADFVDNLARINALADQMPGFVWRLVDEDGADATGLRPFDDPDILVNLSVWESVTALRRFVYKSDHKDFLRRRAEWFVPMAGPALVLWWVPPGHRPTPLEGKQRLERLTVHGPGPDAFTFAKPFPAVAGAA